MDIPLLHYPVLEMDDLIESLHSDPAAEQKYMAQGLPHTYLAEEILVQIDRLEMLVGDIVLALHVVGVVRDLLIESLAG